MLGMRTDHSSLQQEHSPVEQVLTFVNWSLHWSSFSGVISRTNNSIISVAHTRRLLFRICEPVAWLSSSGLSLESSPSVPDSKEQWILVLFFSCRSKKGGARLRDDPQGLFLETCHHFCPHSFGQSRSLGQVQSHWTGEWGLGSGT